MSTLVNLASNYLNSEQEAERWGTEHASIVPYQSFETRDGYMTIGCGNDAQFCDLCALLGMPELAADPKYKSNEDRVANRCELVSILTQRLSEGSNAEWNEVFEGARFPYGAVNSLKEVFNDPQVIRYSD